MALAMTAKGKTSRLMQDQSANSMSAVPIRNAITVAALNALLCH